MLRILCALLRPAGLLAVLLSAGCGGPRAYPVEGTVLYEDGQPARGLAGGTVSLESVADKSNAAAEIQKDGTFRVQNPLGVDGVPAGAYRVLVLPPPDRRAAAVIDPRHHRYDTSDIRIAVKEEVNKVPIKVRRPKRG